MSAVPRCRLLENELQKKLQTVYNAQRMQQPPTYFSPIPRAPLHRQRSAWNEQLPSVQAVPSSSLRWTHHSRKPLLSDGVSTPQLNPRLFIKRNQCSCTSLAHLGRTASSSPGMSDSRPIPRDGLSGRVRPGTRGGVARGKGRR